MREQVGSWVKTRRRRVSGDPGISYKGASRRGNTGIEIILEEGGSINRSVLGGMLVHRSALFI